MTGDHPGGDTAATLTEAEREHLAALVLRDCIHEGRTGRDWCCAACHDLRRRVLAAQPPQDDPQPDEREALGAPPKASVNPCACGPTCMGNAFTAEGCRVERARRTLQPRTDTDLRERVLSVVTAHAKVQGVGYIGCACGRSFRTPTEHAAHLTDTLIASGVVAAPEPATVREAQAVFDRYCSKHRHYQWSCDDCRSIRDRIPTDTTGAGQDEGAGR